jgi:kynurenine formamidase
MSARIEEMTMPEVVETAGRRLAVYDLSQTLSNRTRQFEPIGHEIVYLSAADTAARSGATFGLPAESWPGGVAFCSEVVTLSTHSGTHVDAPVHYGPRPDGAPMRTIEQVPLRWCFGDGVRLDMRRKRSGDGIGRSDVEAELERIDYAPKPYDIVLIWTGASRYFETPGYDDMHPGLRRDATEYLVDRGVRLIGIDAWGLDRPFSVMADEARTGNTDQLWESHVFGRSREYAQIEKLCNLDQLPQAHGFTVIALPAKLDGASAGWSRVVAVFDDAAQAPRE